MDIHVCRDRWTLAEVPCLPRIPPGTNIGGGIIIWDLDPNIGLGHKRACEYITHVRCSDCDAPGEPPLTYENCNGNSAHNVYQPYPTPPASDPCNCESATSTMPEGTILIEALAECENYVWHFHHKNAFDGCVDVYYEKVVG